MQALKLYVWIVGALAIAAASAKAESPHLTHEPFILAGDIVSQCLAKSKNPGPQEASFPVKRGPDGEPGEAVFPCSELETLKLKDELKASPSPIKRVVEQAAGGTCIMAKDGGKFVPLQGTPGKPGPQCSAEEQEAARLGTAKCGKGILCSVIGGMALAPATLPGFQLAVPALMFGADKVKSNLGCPPESDDCSAKLAQGVVNGLWASIYGFVDLARTGVGEIQKFQKLADEQGLDRAIAQLGNRIGQNQDSVTAFVAYVAIKKAKQAGRPVSEVARMMGLPDAFGATLETATGAGILVDSTFDQSKWLGGGYRMLKGGVTAGVNLATEVATNIATLGRPDYFSGRIQNVQGMIDRLDQGPLFEILDNPVPFIMTHLPQILDASWNLITQFAGCQKNVIELWGISACKPEDRLPGWDCADCNKKLAVMCFVGGNVLAEIIPTVVGAVFSGGAAAALKTGQWGAAIARTAVNSERVANALKVFSKAEKLVDLRLAFAAGRSVAGVARELLAAGRVVYQPISKAAESFSKLTQQIPVLGRYLKWRGKVEATMAKATSKAVAGGMDGAALLAKNTVVNTVDRVKSIGRTPAAVASTARVADAATDVAASTARTAETAGAVAKAEGRLDDAPLLRDSNSLGETKRFGADANHGEAGAPAKAANVANDQPRTRRKSRAEKAKEYAAKTAEDAKNSTSAVARTADDAEAPASTAAKTADETPAAPLFIRRAEEGEALVGKAQRGDRVARQALDDPQLLLEISRDPKLPSRIKEMESTSKILRTERDRVAALARASQKNGGPADPELVQALIKANRELVDHQERLAFLRMSHALGPHLDQGSVALVQVYDPAEVFVFSRNNEFGAFEWSENLPIFMVKVIDPDKFHWVRMHGGGAGPYGGYRNIHAVGDSHVDAEMAQKGFALPHNKEFWNDVTDVNRVRTNKGDLYYFGGIGAMVPDSTGAVPRPNGLYATADFVDQHNGVLEGGRTQLVPVRGDVDITISQKWVRDEAGVMRNVAGTGPESVVEIRTKWGPREDGRNVVAEVKVPTTAAKRGLVPEPTRKSFLRVGEEMSDLRNELIAANPGYRAKIPGARNWETFTDAQRLRLADVAKKQAKAIRDWKGKLFDMSRSPLSAAERAKVDEAYKALQADATVRLDELLVLAPSSIREKLRRPLSNTQDPVKALREVERRIRMLSSILRAN